MKVFALLLMAASTSFGLDISGIWRLKHAAADGPSFPIAIEVEQCGSDFQVLRVTATPQGKHVEQLWLRAAAVRILPTAIEISVAGETWMIGAQGELTIHGANGQNVVLEPAEGVVQ